MDKHNNRLPGQAALPTPARCPRGRVRAIVGGALALCLAAAANTAAHADEIGIRAGAGLREYSLDAIGIFWRPDFVPFSAEPSDWRLTGYTELHAARVRRRRKSMTSAGLTIGGWLAHPRYPVRLGFGTGPTYISKTHLPDHGFGSHFQFTSHATVGLDLGHRFSVGYRIEHTSNAGLHSDNKGYDLQMLELRASF